MPRVRNFSALFSLIKEKVLVEPMPSFPKQPLESFAHLSSTAANDLAKGYSEFGYPITELFLDPSVIRLLVKFDSRKKYTHCYKSNFLLGLKTFEETADLPIDYCMNIADIINADEIPVFNLSAAQGLVRELKISITAFLGLEFEKDSRQIRFISDPQLQEMRFYHDRNLIKTGGRARELANAAYTRMVLGDENSKLLPTGIEQNVRDGMAAYAFRYLNQPDARAYSPIALRSPKRHLL